MRTLLIPLLLAAPLALARKPVVEPDPPKPTPPRSTAEILEQSPASDWEAIPPDDLVVMDVGGRIVVMELAPVMAPQNVANIRTLIRGGYFDGLAIVRSHDNYVVQWADPAEESDQARPLGDAKATVPGEFSRSAQGVTVTPLDAPDAYADRVGFVDGFPVGGSGDRLWMAHCYGAIGVARGMAHDSGNGSSLYVVTGHAPRHLDANITLVGRVIDGIEVLSALPRGSGPLGFYTEDEATTPITSIRLASSLPEGERPVWERLRTGSQTFADVVESRKYRHNEWFAHPVGRIGLCNVPLPRREVP